MYGSLLRFEKSELICISSDSDVVYLVQLPVDKFKQTSIASNPLFYTENNAYHLIFINFGWAFMKIEFLNVCLSVSLSFL